jgi:hypothetical protein
VDREQRTAIEGRRALRDEAEDADDDGFFRQTDQGKRAVLLEEREIRLECMRSRCPVEDESNEPACVFIAASSVDTITSSASQSGLERAAIFSFL